MIRGTRCTQTLDVDTAAAVASGVFLRLGIEQAARASGGSLSHAGVLAALRAVDNETFFGRITIDNAQRNTASSDEIVQWDCAGGSSCIQRTIEASGGETLRAFDAACSIGSFRHYNNVTGKERSCVKCAEVDPYFIEEHVLGPTRSSVAVSILAACPVFGSPVVVSFRILGLMWTCDARITTSCFGTFLGVAVGVGGLQSGDATERGRKLNIAPGGKEGET